MKCSKHGCTNEAIPPGNRCEDHQLSNIIGGKKLVANRAVAKKKAAKKRVTKKARKR